MTRTTTRPWHFSSVICLLLPVALTFFLCTWNTEAAYPSSALKKNCAQTARHTEEILGDNFAVLVKAPFVLAGNVSEDRLREWCDDTVYAAAESLWNMFFTQRPRKPIRILLLRGDASYRKTARELYGDRRVSHFGYYRSQDRTMIMNIGTGGGTLVHELTHALMAPDFPDAPVWFSEAMGALFEKCTIREKRIKGLVNWRFPELAKAHRNDDVIPLEELFQKNRSDFNGPEKALLYAEARYLALYLQRRELLTSFYTEFRAHHDTDPTGKKTLQKVTGTSLKDIEEAWLTWVEQLAERRETLNSK